MCHTERHIGNSTWISYLTNSVILVYGSLCQCGKDSSNNFYEQVHRYCHPNFTSKSVNPKMFYKE
jgi:hypothetical protein